MAIALHLAPGAFGARHRSRVEGLFVGRVQVLPPAHQARCASGNILALLRYAARQPTRIMHMVLAICSACRCWLQQ